MIEAIINGKLHLLPQKLSECTEKQMLFILKMNIAKKHDSVLDMQIDFLRKFTSIPFRKLRKLSKKIHKPIIYEEYENHLSNIFMLAQSVKCIGSQFELPKNKIPILRYGFLKLRKLYPPSDTLSNMKTWEMAFAVKYSKEYSQHNPLALDYLTGILYRSSLPFWNFRKKYGYSPEDRRRKFYDALLPLYLKRVKNVPYLQKIAILIWFNTVYQQFVSDNAELFSKASSTQTDEFSWIDMIISFEHSIPGDEKQIAESYALAFFRRLLLHKRHVDTINKKYK